MEASVRSSNYNQDWSTDCYIFKLNNLEGENIGEILRWNQNVTGTFWAQPILFDGNIYALQNVTMEKRNDLSHFDKKIVRIISRQQID